MKRKVLAVGIIILICGILGACGIKAPVAKNDQKLEKITFVLDWTPNTNHTGIYIAQSKGYFEQAGLQVTIVQPPEDGAELLVATGKAQFGISFQDSMIAALARKNALPIQAVAAVLQHNTSGILSRKGEGIKQPKGMEGKKYATWNLDLEKAIISDTVAADGGDSSKVEFIPSMVTDEVSALTSRSVDAIWVFYGWGGIAAEVAGLETDYFAFADINPELDFYSPVIIGNNAWMEQNETSTKAFLLAVKKGYEFAIKNPQESAEILCQAVPELNQEFIAASQQYMKEQYQADAKSWGYIDPKRWNAFYHWVNNKGLSEPLLTEDFGFTNMYLE